MIARHLYRKIDQYLINFMFGKESGLTTPVTEMARAERTIVVRAPQRARTVGATSAAGSP